MYIYLVVVTLEHVALDAWGAACCVLLLLKSASSFVLLLYVLCVFKWRLCGREDETRKTESKCPRKSSTEMAKSRLVSALHRRLATMYMYSFSKCNIRFV